MEIEGSGLFRDPVRRPGHLQTSCNLAVLLEINAYGVYRVKMKRLFDTNAVELSSCRRFTPLKMKLIV